MATGHLDNMRKVYDNGKVAVAGAGTITIGGRVRLQFEPSRLHVFAASSGRRIDGAHA